MQMWKRKMPHIHEDSAHRWTPIPSKNTIPVPWHRVARWAFCLAAEPGVLRVCISRMQAALPIWIAAAIWRYMREWAPRYSLWAEIWAAISSKSVCVFGPKASRVSKRQDESQRARGSLSTFDSSPLKPFQRPIGAALVVEGMYVGAHVWHTVASHANSPRTRMH